MEYTRKRFENEYIFYTTEGKTIAPNEEVEIENCQVLGHIEARNTEQAKLLLLQENPWIEEAGFDTSAIIVKQLFTEEQKADMKAMVDPKSQEDMLEWNRTWFSDTQEVGRPARQHQAKDSQARTQ